MNVFELIKEKLEEMKKYECGIINGYCQFTITKAISIVDEVAKEYPKTPTPDHPIPIDTQQYIEELEAKVNNNGWIPCSERLPSKEEYLKDDGRFIVTDGNRRYQSIYDIYQGGFRTLKLFTNGGSERGWNFEEDKCVIAWQPLPVRYKEGDDEGNESKRILRGDKKTR